MKRAGIKCPYAADCLHLSPSLTSSLGLTDRSFRSHPTYRTTSLLSVDRTLPIPPLCIWNSNFHDPRFLEVDGHGPEISAKVCCLKEHVRFIDRSLTIDLVTQRRRRATPKLVAQSCTVLVYSVRKFRGAQRVLTRRTRLNTPAPWQVPCHILFLLPCLSASWRVISVGLAVVGCGGWLFAVPNKYFSTANVGLSTWQECYNFELMKQHL